MRRLKSWRAVRQVPLYTAAEDRDGLRAAGRFNARLMDFLRPHVQPGITTGQLDELALAFTRDHGHTPACLGYRGYPRTICTSVNQVVRHGIPGAYELRVGDIVNVDCTTIVDGWYGDSSETFLIGDVSETALAITQASFDALWLAIDGIEPYCTVAEIGNIIGRLARERQVGIVENFQGHGIGRNFHQEPGVPHYPEPSAKRSVLAPGACFTIEPMLNVGGKDTVGPMTDGWTVLTRDGSLSAQFEHTILMTENGPEVLTLTELGPQAGHQFAARASDRLASAGAAIR